VDKGLRVEVQTPDVEIDRIAKTLPVAEAPCGPLETLNNCIDAFEAGVGDPEMTTSGWPDRGGR